jgi:uncharacterized paraquat-inducible protein A
MDDETAAVIFWVFVFGALIAWAVYSKRKNKREKEIFAALPSEEQARILAERAEKQKQLAASAEMARKANHEAMLRTAATNSHGPINSAMMCPHCQTKGKVRTKKILQKKGVSGGKAAAAVLTGGVSILAVGLSRKEANTQAHCDNCRNSWLF